MLKRRKKLTRIFLGALIGSLSTFLLFYTLNNFTLFLFKVLISIIMVFVTFGRRDLKTFKDNLTYLYLLSVILGGSIYLLNDHFGYKNLGLIFISKDYSLNLIIILILTPILLSMYVYELKKLKTNYSKYYNVDVLLNGSVINLTAFLDTGNKLKDPITGKPVILVNQEKISFKDLNYFYVPYNALNTHKLLKCVKPDYIVVEGKIIKNVLIGLSENKFNIPGINCILNERVIL